MSTLIQEVTQFPSDGAWSLPSWRGWPFFFCHHRRVQWLKKWYLVWSWRCTTWLKGSSSSCSCNDLSQRSLWLWNWCLPEDDRWYDGVETWQGWHFKVWPYWGRASGSPVTVQEVTVGQICDTVFGLISRCRQHPVVQVLLSEKQLMTNGIFMRIGSIWTVLSISRLEWQSIKKTRTRSGLWTCLH